MAHGARFRAGEQSEKKQNKASLITGENNVQGRGPGLCGRKKRPAEAGRKAKRAGLCALNFQAAARAQ
jgi:hypothetical protein